MRPVVIPLTVLAMLNACVPQSRRIGRIEAAQREHERRLAALKREIVLAEEEAAHARAKAALEQCHATVALLDADVAAQVAHCMNDVASYQACRAQNEKQKGDSTLWGCGLGLLAGFLSGGSTLGWAIAGCGGGRLYGESEATQCEAPYCEKESSGWLRSAYEERGFGGVPLCGLDVEVDVEVVDTAGGVLVTRVVDASGAQSAGIVAGDVVLGANGYAVQSAEDLRAALADLANGSIVKVDVMHGSMYGLYEVVVGVDDGHPVLGIDTGDAGALTYQYVRVVNVAKGSAGARLGLRVGDVIGSWNGLASLGPLDLNKYTAGAAGTWTVVRDGRVVTLVDPAPNVSP